jgi:lipopolysaccharide/colanic/teichoic acid biosynthesis glycosyltransferase
MIVAVVALLAVSPLLLVAAIGIKLSDSGPILYRALRIGRDRRSLAIRSSVNSRSNERRQLGYRGREFTMYKFRTMYNRSDTLSPITMLNDTRIFPFGAWLRATKIDELPQLFNVLKGDMALVGPRPEAPEIVREYYSAADIGTLRVRPGLTSPGALYYFTQCEGLLDRGAIVQFYAETLLPLKLALDRVYLKHASVTYDIRVIVRTIGILTARALGTVRFPDPPELAEVLAEVRGASDNNRLTHSDAVRDADF